MFFLTVIRTQMAVTSEIWSGEKMKKIRRHSKRLENGAWNSDKDKWRELTSTSCRSESKKERKEPILVEKNVILDTGVIISCFP